MLIKNLRNQIRIGYQRSSYPTSEFVALLLWRIFPTLAFLSPASRRSKSAWWAVNRPRSSPVEADAAAAAVVADGGAEMDGKKEPDTGFLINDRF